MTGNFLNIIKSTSIDLTNLLRKNGIISESNVVCFSSINHSATDSSQYLGLTKLYHDDKAKTKSLCEFVNASFIFPETIEAFTSSWKEFFSVHNEFYKSLTSSNQIGFGQFREFINYLERTKKGVDSDELILTILGVLESLPFQNSIVIKYSKKENWPALSRVDQLFSLDSSLNDKVDEAYLKLFELGRNLENLIFGTTDMFLNYVLNSEYQRVGAFVFFFNRKNTKQVSNLKEKFQKIINSFQIEYQKDIKNSKNYSEHNDRKKEIIKYIEEELKLHIKVNKSSLGGNAKNQAKLFTKKFEPAVVSSFMVSENKDYREKLKKELKALNDTNIDKWNLETLIKSLNLERIIK